YQVLFKQGPFELREYPDNHPAGMNAGPRLVDAAETPGTRPAQRLVAFRYASRPAPEREATAAENLKAWAGAHGYTLVGRPVVAYYDASWTPPFLRRNEVLIRVGGRASAE
ncbi:MAG: heme-binding protein, partial [Acidobacteriota bacterium]|nr:heme-binding protein [Acidobacteriota bacterium]